MRRSVVYNIREGVVKRKNQIISVFAPLLILTLGIVGAAQTVPAFADAVAWSGHNGTNSDGSCATTSNDSSITGQDWQFILTKPDGIGPYQLTTTFSPGTQTPSNPITGTTQQNGSIHFIVNTDIGAQLLSASATGGTTGNGGSNLTVSDCVVGTSLPTISSPTISTIPNPETANIGDILNDTATLSGGSNPTGTVTFRLYSPSDPSCEGTPSYMEVSNAAPYGTTTGFAANAVGTWHWTAQYSGDTNNNSADSACADEAVTVSVVSPSLATTPTPATGTTGAVLSDSAVLSGGFSPGGKITFNLYDPSDPTCSGSPIYTEDVTVNGAGTYVTATGYTSTAGGTWRWVAVYSGDSNNNKLADNCDAEQMTISAAPQVLGLSTGDPSDPSDSPDPSGVSGSGTPKVLGASTTLADTGDAAELSVLIGVIMLFALVIVAVISKQARASDN